jgi:6-phosphogluconolactonase (cycloisomerase 2 family)
LKEGAVSDEFPPAFSEFAIGSQIAGYRLEEQIGRGGMAVVYRAYEGRLDRNVALKILAPGLARDDAFRKRFIRESRIAAAVDHPNIIPVFDAGEADGVLFIAMRFVHGPDVRALLEAQGPLPAGRATDIIAQVASALDAAHARGLVHRDVKPANMLLDTAAGGGRQDHVYLSDFGLGKQTLTDLAQTGLTSQGQFLGTLDYIAPEQVEGRHVDGRSDLYALACTGFELLCGTPPFQRDGGMAVVWAKLSEPPPPLSPRRADLPEAVDGVMNRAMAREPAGRFASCSEFAAALRDACGLGPAVLRPPAPPRTATEIALPVIPAIPAARPPGTTPSKPGAEGTGWVAAAGVAEGSAALGTTGAGETAGPPTQAAQIPASPPGRETRPGQTDPGWGMRPEQTEPSVRQPAPLYPAGLYREPRSSGGPSGAAAPGTYGAVAQPAPGHPWWRSRAFMSTAAAVLVVGVVAAAFTALHHGGGTGNGQGTGGGNTASGLTPAVKVPGCTTAAAKAAPLTGVSSQTVALAGGPFGIAVSPDGKYSFVPTGNDVAVLNNDSGSPAPTPVVTIPASGAKKDDAITSNGKYVLAAANSGAYVISAGTAEDGDASAVLGTLTSPGGHGAVGVSLSPDNRFAFITLQNSAEMAVFNLKKSIAGGFGQSGFVGMVPLGPAPIGMAQSPNGRWLYVTTENTAGKLYVLSMSRAETDPKDAVVQVAAAGCSPARVIVSADGSDVWVTDRDSNALVAFSAAKLLTKPSESLVARVNVGQAPIGLTFIKGGSEIMVADSNSKNVTGANTLALISIQRALAGQRGALLGFLPTGHVPREVVLEPGGKTLLATENGSGQLQAIDVGSLP